MKKNINTSILRILVLFLAFTACNVDDDDPIVANTSTIAAEIQFSNTGTIEYASGSDLLVNMSAASTTLSKVDYTVSRIDVDGNETNIMESSVTINAGDTSAVINIDVPFLETVTVTLSNPLGLYKTLGLGANISLELSGRLAPSPDSIEIAFTNSFESPSIWFGLSAFDVNDNWITDFNQNSTGGPIRFQSIPLDGNTNLNGVLNSADILPNYIALNLFPQTSFSEPIGYTIYITMPDGTSQEFSGAIPASIYVDNSIVLVTVADDVNNPGLKTYVFSAL
tara:strand:- start:180 stop:1022 length:843 start_codon:yes stop_codon:yes gene_type:complete